ncbi:MAG: fibronectin type III domain-containing protein, partial [Planctomycetes bacterium]|nr:fibronectin type III domain-containing protein [Planctomycetota bacterium]
MKVQGLGFVVLCAVGGTAWAQAAPSSLSATAVSSSRIDLSWTDNSYDEDGFDIYRSTSAGGPFNIIASTVANVTSYSDTGLAAGTTYYYRVHSYIIFPDAQSGPSNTASAMTPSPGTLRLNASSYSFGEIAGSATINVTRTGGSRGAVSVNYTTSNGTATAGADYTAVSGTLSWADGDAAWKSFTIPIVGDALAEGGETFTVSLSAPAGGATLGAPSTAVVTIVDSPGSLQLSASSYSIAETAGTITISVTRTGGSGGAVSVNYSANDGTATAGVDFVAASGSLGWSDGDSVPKSFTVSVVDDVFAEADETFYAVLSFPSGGATLGTPSWATVTILSNEALDTTAPAAVTNLAVTGVTSRSVTLTWTAPGDDGLAGTAAVYDVRYSTSAITSDAAFAAATAVAGEPMPMAAGFAQSMTVMGLSPSTTYYFAMKTADEVPNWSGLSNNPSGTTGAIDGTAPAAVTNLAVTGVTSRSVTLTWTAPGDDGLAGTAAVYDVR